MGERRFSARVHVEREPERVFEWASDYRNAGKVLEGVTRWKPVGFKTRGTVPLETQLVIDTWREPGAIGWHSESGLVWQAGGWSFEPQDGGTEVTLSIAYRPPAGQVGGALAGRADGLVRGRLEDALRRMKHEIEGE